MICGQTCRTEYRHGYKLSLEHLCTILVVKTASPHHIRSTHTCHIRRPTQYPTPIDTFVGSTHPRIHAHTHIHTPLTHVGVRRNTTCQLPISPVTSINCLPISIYLSITMNPSLLAHQWLERKPYGRRPSTPYHSCPQNNIKSDTLSTSQ